MNVDELYSETILEHNRSKHNKKSMEAPDSFSRGHNPNCGDDITVFIAIKDEVIENITYDGKGCAISEASASIMIDLLKGETVQNAKNKIKAFISMMKKEVAVESIEEELQEATLLFNVSNMPGRVRCAVLAWHALNDSINKKI